MNLSSIATRVLLLGQAAFLSFGLAACSQQKTTPDVSIGTGGSGGNYRVVGHAISRIVNKNQQANGFQVRDQPSSGSVSNLDSVLAGDIEFGIVQADHQHQAVTGIDEWMDKGPQADLRAVLSLYTESVTLVAGNDSGITAMDDLVGKRVDIGLAGSGTRQNAIDALDAAGIDWQNEVQVHEEQLDQRLAMFMHGELDAFFYTIGHPNKDVRFATYSVRGARFVPLANSEQILAASPYYSTSHIPLSQYPRAGNERSVATIGVKATLVTSAKVPDEVVYVVTKAVLEDLGSLAEYDPFERPSERRNA